tara:strand:- start:44 stop:1279 length:1236 start_codon:yes stop_codon:yes gene_type:complete
MKPNHNNILVLASTFPIDEKDTVPSFVKDLVISLKNYNPDTNLTVIAPSYGKRKPELHPQFNHLRYRYFIKRFENLTKKGLIPTIKKNRLYIFVIPFFILFQIIFTIRNIKKIKPDLIYAHWVMPQALTALIIKKIFNIPFVFTTHASDAEVLGKIPYFGKYILNLIVSNSEKFTSVSNNTERKLKKFIKDANWDNKKPLIVPMPVKNNIFEECIEQKVEKIIKNKKIKFTYIGRFSEKKGVEKLIESFSKMLANNKNIELVICGSGYLKNDYIQLVASLGIEDNVIISENFLYPPQLKYIYNISNFIVIPSIITNEGDSEGLPVVLLESLYFGKVTIASTQSNAQEIIKNKKDGFTFNSNNKNDLDKLMKEILENKYDLKEIEENAKTIGSRYISENIAKIHHEHLFYKN